MNKKTTQLFLSLLVLVFCFGMPAQSDEHTRGISSKYSSGLSIPKGLEGRVEFWKLIFTKYGKHHRVFHNRSHPEIIYSVLDFSEFEEKLSGKELLRAKEQEILREEDHIRGALSNLASGGKPRGAFEERIERLYRKLPRFSRSKYYQGLEADQIRYQTGIAERFRESLVRSGRYLKAIEHIFVEEGLPPELGRIPFIESSFDYTAYSSVGAAGIWQFMPATAKRFMQVNSNMDERRDPIIATRGAARYLKNAYEDTESWPLAVTSYNHGLSGILRGAREVGSNNIVDIIDRYKAKSFGFASSNFYAEFLAALEIERNVELFFPGLVREPAVEFEEVRLQKATNFSNLKALTGANADELAELNLGFMKRILENRANIPAGTFVKVPVGGYARLSKSILNLALVSQSSEFKSHLYASQKMKAELAPDLPKIEVTEIDNSFVTEGGNETNAEVIVLGENVSLDSSARAGDSNKKDRRVAVVVKKEGSRYRKLTKPQKTPKNTIIKKTSSNSKEKASYVVKKGDTLDAIAKKKGVSVNALKKANELKSDKLIKAGQKLYIPDKVTSP